MNSIEVLDAATDLRERYEWLNDLVVRLIGPGSPADTRHEWLNQLSIGFQEFAVWRAACQAYEDRHPEPHGVSEFKRQQWRAGLPPRSQFANQLLNFRTRDRLPILLIMNLNKDISPPGWRTIDLQRLTAREWPFFRDWLKVVTRQDPGIAAQPAID